MSDSLDQSLTRLRITPFIWQNAYFDKSTGEAVEVIDTFNILSDLKLVKRKKAGEQSREEGYYKFNDFILKNLLSNYTKPLLLDVVLKFNSELAQLLYVHLDLMLNNRPIYQRRTKELFEDLGLEGDSYKHAANRKQLLERAFKELLGVPLSTGTLNTAKLQKTIDGKDHKAVFRKGHEIVLAVPPPNNPPDTDKGEQPKPILDIEAEARELVRYFFQTFHKTSKTTPSTKAVDQAVGLIAQVGYAQARYVVDFAKTAAEQTSYLPATFGGILQYVGRALNQFEEKQKESEDVAVLEDGKSQAKNCQYCSHHEGWVITKKGARKCTHNPEIEKQFVNT